MIRLDEREFACPLPVVHTKKAIENAAKGEIIVVKVNEKAKEENIKKLARNMGCEFLVKRNTAEDIDISITVGEKVNSKIDSADTLCNLSNNSKTVVVVSSDIMGTGDETLGRNLLKAFFFALTKQDSLPEIIIFYNKGVFNSIKSSENIETLKELEKAGVKIYSCGTCLDYYKLTTELAVGEITNMYDIVSMQEQASRIIRP